MQLHITIYSLEELLILNTETNAVFHKLHIILKRVVCIIFLVVLKIISLNFNLEKHKMLDQNIEILDVYQ